MLDIIKQQLEMFTSDWQIRIDPGLLKDEKFRRTDLVATSASQIANRDKGR
jgi:hypothetical protein